MSRNTWIGLVASVAVVAAAIGLLYAVRAVDGDDVELPDRVGGYVALDLAEAYPEGAPPREDTLDRQRRLSGIDADGWSDAFDDASAASRAYRDPDTEDRIQVQAVRADTGPLLPPNGFVDPTELGLALPPVERVTDGDVECLVYRDLPPRAGTGYQPDQATPDRVSCQRREGTLTVRVLADSGDTDAVVELVDDLWDELA